MLKKIEKSRKNNACSVIEYQLLDGSKVVFSQNLSIYYSFNCKGFPVYKSANSIYLYRNIFGDWCHEKLNQFLPDVRCIQRCGQKRLLPTGVSSPLEARSVELYQKLAATVNVDNQRYKCAAEFNCLEGGCLNGGTCSKDVNDSSHYQCVCKPQFSGLRCDNVKDACHSDPCLNNALCSSKPYDSAKCHCTTGFSGKHCEIYNPCLNNSQCLNGGTCVIEESNSRGFFCECSVLYEGLNCEIPANMQLNKTNSTRSIQL